MSKKTFFVLLVNLLIPFFFLPPLWADEKPMNTIIAVDTAWTIEGLVNQGIGWGMYIDYRLWSFLSARLRHGVVETDKSAIGKRVDNYVSSFLLLYYPWGDKQDWLRGITLGGGFGYDHVVTTDPHSGVVAESFLLPFFDFSLCYQWRIGRFIIEPCISILLPLVDPVRSKTGIAMYNAHVDLEGISLGILF